MTNLRVKAERDAWGTIRGYVYQVDLTIQRWLELQPDFALELERGEDVDTIQQAMRKGEKEETRLLEQIKVRDQKLTLRSSAALGSLAYFYEHERKNSGLHLSYRYVTNAKIAKERKSPIASDTPLLNLWNQINQGSSNENEKSSGLKLIREFLRSVTKPNDFPELTWSPFARFIRGARKKDFESFCRKVEWLAYQPPTDAVAQQIQKTVVSTYGTPAGQAKTVYSVLFLHVFKLLAKSGIKRLTPEDRDNVLRDPQVAPADLVLFANLNFYISQLSDRVGKLEEAVSILQPRALPTSSEIREACRKATERLAAVIVGGRRTIDRENFRKRVREFQSSEERYLVVLGPSGVGKSISSATEAERLLEEGVTALLIRGKYFSLEQAAHLITQEIWPSVTDLSWQKILEVLTENEPTEADEVFLVIDAIDEADDVHDLSLQLTKLHDSMGATSPKKIKIMMTCRDGAWGRFSQQRLMPIYEKSELQIVDNKKQTLGDTSVVVRLKDFTVRELDSALQEIGATELINPGRFGESASAHIETFRDMLRHPATFEHYAALRLSNDEISIQEITWSYLVGQRLRKALEKAGRQCHQSADSLRKLLERMAILSWQTGAKDFELSNDGLNSAIPELTHTSRPCSLSPLTALIENRLLNESVGINETRVAFYVSDIGAYLLSFELERQVRNKSPQEVRDAFDQWLKQSWDFHPLLDSLLALLDRLVDQPYSSTSLAMVEVFVESDQLHNSSIFELMRPEVLKTIFEIIKRADLNSFYDYRDAALRLRPSASALDEIRSHLRDENALRRQLAAELAGAHQDEIAIDELIQLLRDPDEDVRDKAYRAFGYIGRPAVVPLLRIIDQKSQSVELRSSCLTALRNVGLRTPDISAALTESMRQAGTSPELLDSSLLAAAGLRDRGHANAARKALQHKDSQIILAAAKYLTEVPEPRAFNALRAALKPQASIVSAPHLRDWSLNQMMKALWETDKVKAGPILLQIIDNALQGRGELIPFRAIHLAEKVDLPAISAFVFRRLIKQLQEGFEGKLIWESAKVLGATWRTDHLEALVDENNQFAQQGIDTAKLLVDAIIPGIKVSEEFPLGDRLNRVTDLPTVVKCQAATFAPEAAHLFDHSGGLSCMKLADLLWVCGDTRVEGALIHKLENPSEKQLARYERSHLVRALGTCGETKQAANAVLNYMRNEGDNISYEFEQETLYPLLSRNVVSEAQLIDTARDSEMPWASRSACLQALSLTKVENYTQVFSEVAESSADQPRLQNACMWLLGATGDRSVIPQLRHFLRDGQHVAIKAQAAKSLAWFNDVSSVHEIERALEASHAPGYLSALAHFRHETSLPLLIDRFSAISYEHRAEYLRALAAFWKYPEGRAAILDEFDRWPAPEERYLNNQTGLMIGLIEYEPDVILNQFNKSFDDGYVNTGARARMARGLADLFYRKYSNETLLLETAKRLLSDKYVPARERTGHALGFADASFCLRLYKEMHDSPGVSEWETASSVYSLGFWKSPIALIEAARYDEELLVRRTADAALEIRLKRPNLERHFEQYNSQSGLARLSSYLCLEEQGDQSTIWALNDDKKTSSFARTFRRHLYKRIEKRLGDEYKTKLEEEKKLPDSRGAITFD